MKVHLKFLGAVSYARIYKTELENNLTFKDTVKLVREIYPDVKEIEKKVPVVILLNGRKIDLDTPVRDGIE